MKKQQDYTRLWDLPAVFLLAAAFMTAATRLVSTGWTRHLEITQTIAILGLVLGTAIGYSRFSPGFSLVLGFSYGIILLPWQLGSTIKDEILWPERLVILFNRSQTIINQLLNREVVHDSLLFLILMAVLFWALSVYSSYILTRYGKAWRAILPLGFVLLVIQSFDAAVERRLLYLGVFIFIGLLLIARMFFIHQQTAWKQNKTALPPHLGVEFIRIAVLTVAFIVIFVWAVPAMARSVRAAERAWQPVREVWLISQDYLDNAFAALQTSVGIIPDYYGKSALLGRGNPLDDTRIFTVMPAGELPDNFRLYWRARNYDKYENGQWSSTKIKTRIVNPDETDLQFTYSPGRMKRTFEIIPANHMTTLFSANDPLWINRKTLVEMIEFPGGITEVSSLRASPNLMAGQSYQIQSSLSYVSEEQLRNAGSDYPDWILERYLQMPETITPRTIQLAEQITATHDNPFDKAVAITNYLRANIEYTETVPQKPENQDAVDWVLFDLKQGFCNYYATSQVMLLRAIGIPARFVMGYAQGELLNEVTFEYLVRQRDAHAWPEVFFPNIGWVEFEPTVSQDILVRPSIIESNAGFSGLQPGFEFEERRPDQTSPGQNFSAMDQGENPNVNPLIRYFTFIIYIFVILSTALLIIFVWRFRKRIDLSPIPIYLERSILKIGFQPPNAIRNWARRAALPPITKAYQEINIALDRIGYPPPDSFTPDERATYLSSNINKLIKPAQDLVSEYQTSIFSEQHGDLKIAQEAGAVIKSTAFRVYLNNLVDKINFRRPKKTPPLGKL